MWLAAIAVAAAFWGPPVPQCPVVAYHVADLSQRQDGALGIMAQRDGWCEVQIRAGRWRWGALCSVLVHEAGHAHAYRDPVGFLRPDGTRDYMHSPDPSSVMFPRLERTADVCRGKRPASYRPGAMVTLR